METAGIFLLNGLTVGAEIDVPAHVGLARQRAHAPGAGGVEGLGAELDRIAARLPEEILFHISPAQAAHFPQHGHAGLIKPFIIRIISSTSLEFLIFS